MRQVTSTTGKTLYTTNILAGNHQIIADEPEDIGGQDLGATPMELLAASLASCTSITLRMYADRKNWAIDEIKVEVNIVRNKEKTSTDFQKTITVKGALDEEMKQLVLSIANACPVHKILSNTVAINSELVMAATEK